MVNIRGEAWKEAKIVAVSAVETRSGDSEEPVIGRNRASYRAGLWNAARFVSQQWAESCQRWQEVWSSLEPPPRLGEIPGSTLTAIGIGGHKWDCFTHLSG